MRILFVFLIFILPVVFVNAAEPIKEKGYMGIYQAVVTELPSVDGAPNATGGVRIDDTRDNAPAYRSGLRTGDIIIAFGDYVFDCPGDQIDAKFKSIIDQYYPGDSISVKVLRMVVDKKLLANGEEKNIKDYLSDPDTFVENLPDTADLSLTLNKKWVLLDFTLTFGSRNEGLLPGPPTIDQTDLDGMFERPYWEPWVEQVVDRYDIREEYDDLLCRLENLHVTDDGYRLPIVSAIHRDPFLAESIARGLTDLIITGGDDSYEKLNLYMTGKNKKFSKPVYTSLDINTDDEGFKKWFIDNMTPLVGNLQKVFDVFTPEEKDFLMKYRFDLTDFFAEHVYIHEDEDTDKLDRNRKTIELGGKIDQSELYAACYTLAIFITDTQDAVFKWIEKHPDSRSIETPWGKIGFGTKNHDWWREGDFKFIYDPAGDDLYSNGTATADSFEKPVSWVIDREGNDAYQSTASSGAQGSGTPGLGILLDEKGNDTYIGQRWSQGTAFMGIGLLCDFDGDDIYHGTEFVQGSGLFGFGALADLDGDDQYFGTIHAQGCGFTKGMGILLDSKGNDSGYATGKLPTNYGDPGIFDAWSQGCGIGFRGIASGGVGVLIDVEGDDKWEAGNFSQGGGYYYGIGIFRAYGDGNDRYIGSRYAQGFCAHQAIGVFIEDGGDDWYWTRQAVNAGLAWDECVTVFIEESGDDYYNGGGGFSLGASAHNAFMFWLDKGGKDSYNYPGGPALAGGNDYHGGHSLSFFVDKGNEIDFYDCQKVQNDVELAWPDYGIFRDGLGEIKSPQEKPKPPEK
jgi:hypothetical protein